jgi:uncharacterized membrane protein YbaN (DUF454 family)
LGKSCYNLDAHHSIETGIKSIYHSTKNKTKATRSWVRIPLIAAGTLFVGLGVLGIFIPVLPTTPFLLLAAICYARSSQRFYHWLLNNRWFGSYIRNYLQKRGVPLKVKVVTLALLWLAIGCSAAFAVQVFAARLILILIAIGVSIHVLSLRTLKE